MTTPQQTLMCLRREHAVHCSDLRVLRRAYLEGLIGYDRFLQELAPLHNERMRTRQDIRELEEQVTT